MDEQIGFDTIWGVATDGHSVSLPVVTAILALVLLIGLLSSRPLRSRSAAVRQLFLKTGLRQGGKQHTGYIRTLDRSSAFIVTSFAPVRGSVLEVDLGSLPKYPVPDSVVIGRARQIKALGGQPLNFMVHVKFDKTSAEQSRESLDAYLKQLIK